MRKPRRRCPTRLRRRYGCFRLPTVPGAKVVKEARKGVGWLARTDPDNKEVEFSEHWNHLKSEDEKRYIVAHEQAHLDTGPDHNDAFFTRLTQIVAERRIPWKVAYRLENYNCHHRN